jgi:hypothetical protein
LLRGGALKMSVSIKNDFNLDRGYRMVRALVDGCNFRALVAAVDIIHGGITVLGASTGEKGCGSPPLKQFNENGSEVGHLN